MLATKVDFHASVVKLARHAAMHMPSLIFGEGQGGLIAAGFAMPGVVEAAFLTRSIQEREAHKRFRGATLAQSAQRRSPWPSMLEGHGFDEWGTQDGHVG